MHHCVMSDISQGSSRMHFSTAVFGTMTGAEGQEDGSPVLGRLHAEQGLRVWVRGRWRPVILASAAQMSAISEQQAGLCQNDSSINYISYLLYSYRI